MSPNIAGPLVERGACTLGSRPIPRVDGHTVTLPFTTTVQETSSSLDAATLDGNTLSEV